MCYKSFTPLHFAINIEMKVVEFNMASIEQQNLSNFIKTIHSNLRELSHRIGPDAAWQQHLQNHEDLQMYSEKMKQLSENFWDDNQSAKDNRIEWIHGFCCEYFAEASDIFNKSREKEIKIKNVVSNPQNKIQFSKEKLRLLDVGSCFNPLKRYDLFDSTGIDIAPAEGSDVYKCDFLNVPILDNSAAIDKNQEIIQLPLRYYDVVVFSLLLEYIPSSRQRLIACEKAYEILKPEGILIIVTPDSKHIGANAKLMKNWRYTLSLMGFSRIRIEKLTHITCMVFRKALYKDVPQRWASIHREDYMTNELNIPQDFLDRPVDTLEYPKISADSIKDSFYELPGNL